MLRCRITTSIVAFAFSACSKGGDARPAAEAQAASPPAANVEGTRSRARPDLCSLVTQAEAESILGKKLAAPKKQPGGDCWYMREGGSDFGDVEFILSLINAPVRSASEFEAFVQEQAKEMNANVKASGLSVSPFTVEPAPGVGAPAYFIDPGLYVYKGSFILAVGLGGDKGVALAKIAVNRMP